MKSKFSLILFLLLAASWSLESGSREGENGRIWIFFKDRPYLKARSLHPAQVTDFKAASIQRRMQRAAAGWEDSDFAVDPQYVKAVKDAGARIKLESRWLNAVSALCDAQCRMKVSSFPFVTELSPVHTYRRPLEMIEDVKGIQSLSPTERQALAYGPSRNQLNQLKVPQVHKKGFAGEGEIVAIFDSGFRKDHIAFAGHEIVAERDFVFDDNDVSNGQSADSHGTSTWSCVNGEAPGKLYGPAYKAKVILAATEDIRSETVVEEDNWVAAFELADRLGATVVSSSLGYSDWYVPADYNGTTAITSRVATMAAKKGIVVVNSAGNSGPGSSTLGAPADAKDILAVGAVNSGGFIAGFSSRGPTADGRIKPEVVARGVFTYVATDSDTNTFGVSSGTSFSCPLTAGCAAVLLSARRDWTPLQVREAFIKTASRAATPDNAFGYGIVNLLSALDYLPLKSVVIDHKPLKNTANTTLPYRVQARIRAQRGLNLNQQFLLWKLEGGPFHKVHLVDIPGAIDSFQAAIPAQSKGSIIFYYISARDSRGKLGTFPVNAPSESLQFKVQ
jgi:serine protease AprX